VILTNSLSRRSGERWNMGSPYPLAYDEHKTFRNTVKPPTAPVLPTNDILLSKGTEALTPQIRSAYSTGSGSGDLRRASIAFSMLPPPSRGARLSSETAATGQKQRLPSRPTLSDCRRNTCRNFERPAGFSMSPSDIGKLRQLPAGPNRANRSCHDSAWNAPMVSAYCGVSGKGASPNTFRGANCRYGGIAFMCSLQLSPKDRCYVSGCRICGGVSARKIGHGSQPLPRSVLLR
jgi:hypothetical protein